MGKRKDLTKFDMDQIVMDRRLGQSISKTAAPGLQWLLSIKSGPSKEQW